MPDDRGTVDKGAGAEPGPPPDAPEATTVAATPGERKLPELPAVGSPDFDERMGEFARARDAQRNRETRPPDGEAVTFRSITLAEVYVGRQCDSLTATLREIEWVNSDGAIAENIQEARKGDIYARDNFTLLSSPDPVQTLFGYGMIGLPAEFKRIYGRYYVLGPSMVALVLTFVLTDADARQLDTALRNDAESIGVQAVYHVKSERAARLREGLGKRCLTWLEERFPGICVTGGSPGVPTCSLVSFAKGRPFQTRAQYMRLLELGDGLPGFKFAPPGYLYLTPSIGRTRRRDYIAAFNEVDALAPGSCPNLSVAPEILHDTISPLLVKEALEAVFHSFESRMRGIRSALENTDFDPTTEQQAPMARLLDWLGFTHASDSLVVELRNQLLRLSRDIAIVCGDVAGVVDAGFEIWRDYPRLQPVPNRYGEDGENPADAARNDLRSLMTNIQAQESGLRELVVVTSQAVSDMQNAETQKRLNALTIALVLLTVALVFIGIVQIV